MLIQNHALGTKPGTIRGADNKRFRGWIAVSLYVLGTLVIAYTYPMHMTAIYVNLHLGFNVVESRAARNMQKLTTEISRLVTGSRQLKVT